MDGEARTLRRRGAIRRDGLPRSINDRSPVVSWPQPAAVPSKTYRVQGIPASYSCKSTKDLLDSVLGLGDRGSCVQIHSLATSPYDPKENVATVTFSEIPPALTSERTEWKFPFMRGQGRENEFPMEKQEITIDIHFEGFTALNVSKCDEDHKIE